MKEQNLVSIGLYRHFKGEYYYVQQLVKDCGTNEVFVIYFNVCHPEYGTFSRPLEDFVARADTELTKDGDTATVKITNRYKTHSDFVRFVYILYKNLLIFK